MTSTEVQGWLDRYVAAWASHDRADIESLFSDDASYRIAPWDEPLIGASAIADSWLEVHDEPGTWTAEYRPLMVSGTEAVGTGETAYLQEGHTFSNLFMMRFDETGRCADFVEWYMKHPKSE